MIWGLWSITQVNLISPVLCPDRMLQSHPNSLQTDHLTFCMGIWVGNTSPVMNHTTQRSKSDTSQDSGALHTNHAAFAHRPHVRRKNATYWRCICTVALGSHRFKDSLSKLL